MSRLRSWTTYLRTLSVTARVCAPTIIEGATGRMNRQVCDARLKWWTAKSLAYSESKVHVLGGEHVDAFETYVVMSNHQSNYDIFAIYHAFPGSLRMVAKAEMRRLPLLGAAMEAAEFVFVDRANNTQARASLDVAAERISSGVSVWIAPEGTRSKTGELGRFKKGGFMLALAAGVRILPATVRGTRDVLPISSTQVQHGKEIHVEFHPPIDPAEFGLERRDELMETVRAAIQSGLAREI